MLCAAPGAMSLRVMTGCRMRMRLTAALVFLFAACGVSPPGVDGGSDAGLDAGPAPASCVDARPWCDWAGRWQVAAQLAADFDAGGFTPCLPLPALGWTFSLDRDGGAWCSDATLAWVDDAGCTLGFRAGFSSSNPSEQYWHAIALALEPADGGVTGRGTYELTGGSNCTVPLEAAGARVP